MARVAIVDTGPLIALAGIERLGFLDALFDEVLVSFDVWIELAAKLGAPEPLAVAQLRSVRFLPAPRAATGPEPYGPGEDSVLALADAFPEATVIIDDRVARRAAIARGFHVTGTIGVLLEAKRNGLADVIKPLLVQLQANGYRLSGELVRRALATAGEP